MPTDALAYALAYAGLGWRVHPLEPTDRSPYLNGWPARASTDPETITQWWRQWPDASIGIATGPGSGLYVLDIDPRHGGDDTFADLEKELGPAPHTVEALTGGGGRHLYLRHPELDDSQALTNSSGKLGPGLDIRGHHGYVVAPPSIHPSGQAYTWEHSALPTEAPVATWEALDALVVTTPTVLPDGQVGEGGDPRFAWDAYNLLGTPETVRLLTDAGWHSPRTDRDGTIYLTRPGKTHGTSCSVGKVAPGVVVCFTSSAPPLEAERGYRPAELRAVLHHDGDRAACDAELVTASGLAATHSRPPMALETYLATAGQAAAEARRARDGGPQPIDWPAFWSREHIGEDWLVEPVLPRGRQVALWASHKTGKSLITLEMAAGLATGRAVLAQPEGPPVDVVYLDMEMTEDDLHERLSDMGYGPEVDLSRLHYYLLPWLPPLDTDAGGRELVAIAQHHGAAAVVIDTMSRVISGEENSADTIRAFYRHTGLPLKSLGVSVLRLDHGGKDPAKGQRGTSSKGDDVDVVWKLSPLDSGLQLKKDVARMTWVPDAVTLTREEAPLRHVVTSGLGYLAGTKDVADELEEMGVDPSLSLRAIVKAYRDAGRTAGNDVLRSAAKFHKSNERRKRLDRLVGDVP